MEHHDNWDKEAPAGIVLSVLAAAMLCGALVSGGATIVSAVMHGLNPDTAMQMLSNEPTQTVRGFFRFSQGASHFFMFIVAAIGTMWALSKSYVIKKPYHSPDWAYTWSSYFNLERWPKFQLYGLGVLLIFCAAPMVQYLYAINKALPLADWMRALETDTANALKGLLIMDNIWEFLGNMLIVAVLPGIGEELVFRGIMQPQLEKITKNPWTSIVITACIFSAIHMQFEGFFPRVLMGVLLGWLYWKTANLWVPILAHVFNNGIQVAAVYAKQIGMTKFDIEQDYDMPWYAAFGSLVLVIALGVFLQNTLLKQKLRNHSI